VLIHLRIVAPEHCSNDVVELLEQSDSVTNVVHLRGVAAKPKGDLILSDVAREDASAVISRLRELPIEPHGSIAVDEPDAEIGEPFVRAEHAAAGLPSDAVVWEMVRARTSEDSELSLSFLSFMALAMMIAAAGIFLDEPILIVGAMIVGPEFGPLAGVSVALVQRRGELAARSLKALLVGFPVGIVLTLAVTEIWKLIGLVPDSFDLEKRVLTEFIANPDWWSPVVAFLAGAAGVLSLTSAKSGALIGVLVSVTTIPAAANIAVAATYRDWDQVGGAALQLIVNLTTIILAGVITLLVQREVQRAMRRRDERRRTIAT